MKEMKKFFNGFFASVMALIVAASFAEKPIDDVKQPQDEQKTSAKFEFVNAPKKAEFEFGQTQTFAVKYSDIEEFGITQPKGWTALVDDENLVVTAPAEDAKDAELEGEIEVRYSGEDGIQSVAKFNVYVNVPEEPVTPENPSESVTFELVLSNVTTTTADLKVIPSDDTVGYYFDVCTKESFDSVNGDVYYLVASTWTIFRSIILRSRCLTSSQLCFHTVQTRIQ